MTSNQTCFYIEPTDAFTNNAFVENLERLGQSTSAESLIARVGGKNAHIVAFKVDYSFIEKVQKSLNEFPFKFRVYKSKSGKSKVYEWTFHKTRRVGAKVRQAKSRLAELS